MLQILLLYHTTDPPLVPCYRSSPCIMLQNHHKASVHVQDVPHILFDYHSECRGGNTRNLIKLRDQLKKQLTSFGYFHYSGRDITGYVWVHHSLLTLGVTNKKCPRGVHQLELFIRVLLKNHNIANNYRTNVIEFCC